MKDMRNRVPENIYRGSLIHSDQGFQYTHPLYRKSLTKMYLVQSMSRKGACIDNAPVESFFGHMKDELTLRDCQTFEEARVVIDEYMRYYNNERKQWGRKKMTPVEYRSHLEASSKGSY
jgi:putative transposase